MAKCKLCGLDYEPTNSKQHYCKRDECKRNRHRLTARRYYRKHFGKSEIIGRPRIVEPENRSAQLQYYYKKKKEQV